MRRRIGFTMAAMLTLGMAAAGCSAGGAQSDKLSIVAAFYPMQYVAQQIAGEHAEVINLVKPGVEPHDLELAPDQVAKLADSDLVLYLKGFQPAVDEAVEQHVSDPEKALDVTKVGALLDVPEGDEHEEGEEAGHAEEETGKDPHLWLDPTRYADVAAAVGAKLGELDPDHQADYTAGAKRFATRLAALDEEYTKGLADCQRREIVVSHAAFGYLTRKYDLEQVAIAGLSPEQEPSPKRLAEVAKIAKEHGATVIFFETLVSPKVAQTLAKEVGAKAKVLDPIEGLNPDSDADYLSVMRTNLTALRSALDCS